MRRLADPPATFTTSQARDARVQYRDLYAARDSGELVELSRGVFRKADAPAATYPDLLAVAYRAPEAVVYLIPAAAVHDLTDEVPLAVQVAVAKGHARPQIAYPPVAGFAWSPTTVGLDVQVIETAPGEPVRVYSPARTVVDLLRLGPGSVNRSRSSRCVATWPAATPGSRTCSSSPRPSTCWARRAPPWRCSPRHEHHEHLLVSWPTRADPAGRGYLGLARSQGRPPRIFWSCTSWNVSWPGWPRAPHADRFVITGGMLLAARDARRATADADLLARSLAVDTDQVLATIVQIASSSAPEEDGVIHLLRVQGQVYQACKSGEAGDGGEVLQVDFEVPERRMGQPGQVGDARQFAQAEGLQAPELAQCLARYPHEAPQSFRSSVHTLSADCPRSPRDHPSPVKIGSHQAGRTRGTDQHKRAFEGLRRQQRFRRIGP